MSNAPVRLQRRVNMSLMERLEQFVLDHATFFLSLAIIILFALFITVCVAMCGASATESGLQYNQMENIVNGY